MYRVFKLLNWGWFTWKSWGGRLFSDQLQSAGRAIWMGEDWKSLRHPTSPGMKAVLQTSENMLDLY